MSAQTPAPVTLTGSHVRLEPLGRRHVPDLFQAAGKDEEVFRWLPWRAPQSESELAAIVEGYLANTGCEPFAVVERASGRAVGISCYYDANVREEWVEIGGTWYGRSVWRSAVNTEAKLLLLSHAFEELGMGRVMWKTDHLNERSQNAIKRLGAQYEGTFRRARQRPDGSWRNTVYFSMLAEEWPAAKQRLTERLAAG
ncbi:GNAT family N-acetyltransferase [Kitasatospora kifunensis]|uniref:RimJ/RimL family protein N-acetyltransferase n=1 Tax=Kitasatospora kifunensis TaxID=58351 RepID=A0A7W7VW82_KITKI|nr:GNAT family protein [Kitasatospora kifunensis]MBB4924285.1 RimJ/RimL family protein N-acetyltransferase [Kitasatospora kifunensis]